MNHLATPRRLVILSLIVMIASVISFSVFSVPVRAASGAALIARNLHQPTSSDPTNDYHLSVMDEWGNTTPIATPATLSKRGLPFFGDSKSVLVSLDLQNRLEVIDLAKGTDKLYPLPTDIAQAIQKNGPNNLSLFDSIYVQSGRQLLLDANPTWYLLDLSNGSYTSINITKDTPWPFYYPFAQSPADGLIYANWGCQCDGGPGGIARYDLQGNRQTLDLHLGKYLQASEAIMSPAGYYLYFLARDPDQPAPQHQGPGIDANVIMRYRISDGTSNVIVRAAPGNIIGDYTLTSNDPDITYEEIVPATDSSGNYNGTAKQSLIKREDLATFAPSETLINNALANHLLWCGDTLYYNYLSSSDGSNTLTASYDPSSGVSGFAAGQLLGCAP